MYKLYEKCHVMFRMLPAAHYTVNVVNVSVSHPHSTPNPE